MCQESQPKKDTTSHGARAEIQKFRIRSKIDKVDLKQLKATGHTSVKTVSPMKE